MHALHAQSFNAVIQAIEETGLSTDSAAATTVELTDKLREAIEFYTKQTFKEKVNMAVWGDQACIRGGVGRFYAGFVL